MPSYNIVIFGGDHCGPEVCHFPFHYSPSRNPRTNYFFQVTAEAVKVNNYRAIELRTPLDSPANEWND